MTLRGILPCTRVPRSTTDTSCAVRDTINSLNHCCCCSHINSSPQYNAVRGRRTGSKTSGVEEIPLGVKENKQRVLHNKQRVLHTITEAHLHLRPNMKKRGPRAYVSDTCGTQYKSPQKPRRPHTTQKKIDRMKITTRLQIV